jgi:hypothetical protein
MLSVKGEVGDYYASKQMLEREKERSRTWRASSSIWNWQCRSLVGHGRRDERKKRDHWRERDADSKRCR